MFTKVLENGPLALAYSQPDPEYSTQPHTQKLRASSIASPRLCRISAILSALSRVGMPPTLLDVSMPASQRSSGESSCKASERLGSWSSSRAADCRQR